MILIIPFIVAFLTGILIYRVIHRRYPWSEPLDIIVSFWLGIGACALITFYTIALFNGFNPVIIQCVLMVLLIALCFSCRFRSLMPDAMVNRLDYALLWVKFAPVVLIAGVLLSGLAYNNPFGDWDAWSFWNFRARFLVNAGDTWRDIYAYGIQAKHPWLLPHWTVFGWAMLGAESNAFPCLSAQLFTLVVIATVFFAVFALVGQIGASLLASVWLLSIPYFMIHGISQYADILMAGLIAINMMLLLRLRNAVSIQQAITLGLMLGIMCFTKDEGLVAAVIMFFLIGHLLPSFSKNKQFYVPCLLSIGAIGVGVVFQKVWMWPAPQGVNSIDWGHLLDMGRWVFILKYFVKVFTHYLYGGVVLIPILLLVMSIYRRWDEASAVMVKFLLIFISVFYLLYVLVRQDLEWRLWTTAYRLTFQLLPLSIIVLFYRIFAKR